jgi:hypothetical protein
MRCVLLANTSLPIYTRWQLHRNAFLVNLCRQKQWNVSGSSCKAPDFHPHPRTQPIAKKKKLFSRQISVRDASIKFHKIPSSRSRADRRTDKTKVSKRAQKFRPSSKEISRQWIPRTFVVMTRGVWIFVRSCTNTASTPCQWRNSCYRAVWCLIFTLQTLLR